MLCTDVPVDPTADSGCCVLSTVVRVAQSWTSAGHYELDIPATHFALAVIWPVGRAPRTRSGGRRGPSRTRSLLTHVSRCTTSRGRSRAPSLICPNRSCVHHWLRTSSVLPCIVFITRQRPIRPRRPHNLAVQTLQYTHSADWLRREGTAHTLSINRSRVGGRLRTARNDSTRSEQTATD